MLQGAKDALSGGPIEGAPLEDVLVRVDKVTTFGTASGPQALRIAAASAVRAALEQAGGVLLQPIMKIEVVVPDDLAAALDAEPQLRAFFDDLSNSLQRFHVDAVVGAKTEATRQRRVDKAVDLFREGKKR